MPVANGLFTNAMFFDALLFSWQGTAVVWGGPLQWEGGTQLLLTSNGSTEECNAWLCMLAGLILFLFSTVQLLLAKNWRRSFCSAWIEVWVLYGNEHLVPLAICRGLGHESNVDGKYLPRWFFTEVYQRTNDQFCNILLAL